MHESPRLPRYLRSIPIRSCGRSLTLCENTMAAHPLNAEGDFYVEHGCCTACDVPMQSAPTLFAYDETSHCFVKRQPSTRAECDMMFEAIRGAELQCIRYRGKDNDWYRRLVSSGDLAVCDHAPNDPVQPREFARSSNARRNTNRLTLWLMHLNDFLNQQKSNISTSTSSEPKQRTASCTPIDIR